jgi:hypothetical protein
MPAKETTMYRSSVLAIVALLGLVGWSQAQPPYSQPYSPYNRPPAAQRDITNVRGVWFYAGDPYQPCRVEVLPSRYGPRLLFTNERGEQSEGHMIGPDCVMADDWNVRGDIRGGRLHWSNGTVWER